MNEIEEAWTQLARAVVREVDPDLTDEECDAAIAAARDNYVATAAELLLCDVPARVYMLVQTAVADSTGRIPDEVEASHIAMRLRNHGWAWPAHKEGKK